MQKKSLVVVFVLLVAVFSQSSIAGEEWWDFGWKISQMNKNLSESQVDELENRNLPKCRNVLVGGPIATHFEDSVLMTQMNGRNGVFSNPSPTIVKEFNDKMKWGIHCSSNYPHGLNCSGIGYLDPVVGEVVRVNRSRYKRYGDLTDFYVPVMIRWPGSTDYFLAHAEKRNTRCSGNPEGPGVATGMPGVNNDRFIFW